jgi:hypothetical protein
MLLRWSAELAGSLGEFSPASENITGQELQRLFATLLGRVSQRRRVAVVIDDVE